MNNRGFVSAIECIILVAVIGVGVVAYNILTPEEGVVMANINSLNPSDSAEFDAQVTEYVENGMDGCLYCEAGNDQIKVGTTLITDDGSQISIGHKCLNCGVEWSVSYAAFSIQASGTAADPAGVLN
jgi:hypothetical protein